jgi:hypothetical protein
VHLLKTYTLLRDACHGPQLALFLHENRSLPDRAWFQKKFYSFLSHDFGGHSAHAGGATYDASLTPSFKLLVGGLQQPGKFISVTIPTIRAEQQLAFIRLHQQRH